MRITADTNVLVRAVVGDDGGRGRPHRPDQARTLPFDQRDQEWVGFFMTANIGAFEAKGQLSRRLRPMPLDPPRREPGGAQAWLLDPQGYRPLLLLA